MSSTEIQVNGRRLAVSNLDKVLYPAAGFTKGDVLEYYREVAEVLLPHLKDRPLTLKRYPDGVERGFFYEKQCPAFRPAWLKVATVWSRHRKRHIGFCLINDLPALIWVANLADLELHASLARYPDVDRPTTLVFDLDPGDGVGILECAEVACWLRDRLERVAMESFCKTSGSKGLQVYVPLNTPTTFAQTKDTAHAVAEQVARDHPEQVVTQMAKRLRKRKVFIDWSQNDRHKTTVCVYSLRAMSQPSVSTPLRWSEVAAGLKERRPAAFIFTPAALRKRTRKFGDLFEGVLHTQQRLPKHWPQN